MSGEGTLTSCDFRLGFHKPINRPWKPVIYSAVEINGTLYAVLEGCIIIGTVAEQEIIAKRIRENRNAKVIFTDPQFELEGGAIKGASYRWPNGIIPYEIENDLPNQERVLEAINHWELATKGMIKFKTKTDEPDWVFFTKSSGCATSVGRQGGKQAIFLGDACTKGNVIHEIGHSVGFYHEQSRSDRDTFVEIKWANVDPAYQFNFSQEDSDNKSAYDYGSIMHYPRDAFSLNRQDTIVPRQPLPPGVVMGQRDALSAADIESVSKLYAK
ncbi:M12 family metallopeptidase [Caballeronia sp. GAOx1]|uniref:M12 family metallopeptidase n=1 Tax=Caballeronia sp. GAOx1 TaxID=2921761 RepID=UPI0020285706|nr:M12 family metallopeptidase [Caballeronia sp. GAOx1]